MGKLFILQRKSDGYFYAGFGKWSKNIKDVHIYATKKGALQNVHSKDYSNMELCEIKIDIIASNPIIDSEFELAYNYYYKEQKKETKTI